MFSLANINTNKRKQQRHERSDGVKWWMSLQSKQKTNNAKNSSTFCHMNCRVILWLFVFEIYTLRVGMVALKAILSPYTRTLLPLYTSNTFLHAATTMNIFENQSHKYQDISSTAMVLVNFSLIVSAKKATVLCRKLFARQSGITIQTNKILPHFISSV